MTKRSILAEMQQSDQVVHVIDAKAAEPLLAAKLVRRVTIDPPAPKGKIAVNLTSAGRGATAPANPTEEDQPPAPG